ncbi:hypothetical protein PHYSODRAFT_306618 [Phytophthora sojae]|uniref:Uncharacterized protein n=1 Tax=Phytophthora sojae (strain P6497) TaxID=1094619 RepID=G5AA17_PHYSP|nr:hypothetical protein PHYSODRAFT_306618 [Phytophthora sojae]EGZ07446.1 hypothetical protein PHYSODRAFT_306618 [Phytophthora sojae]|eukprot:XP_009537012.1 hypothetical protein PHYSODRAFT_306618 [Phytophthora sojae]
MFDLLSGQTRANHRESSDCEANYTIPITRAAEPVVEWDANGKLFAGAFSTLFLRGGDILPKGAMPKHLVDHLFKYYDGRFEEDVVFVATLFNQKQRLAAVRKAAYVCVTHGKALLKLAKLANDDGFKQQLLDAQSNPTSTSAKMLNAQLLRVLSIVGEPVPFSPFEIASARPNLAALSCRYGLAHHWTTLVPREHDDLRLHRIAQLRKLKQWNQPDSTRVSRDFDQREAGAFGKVAAFGAVVEPQNDGRLHAHMTVYNSTWSLELLTRLIPSPRLCEKAARWLDTSTLLRPCEMEVPSAQTAYNRFKLVAERCAAATNFHRHSATCLKGKQGRFRCRLSRPAGVFEDDTRPIELRLIREGTGTKHKETKFALIGSHTNSSVLASKDAGEVVNEYQRQYMTNDTSGLKSTTSAMMSAITYAEEHGSTAEDSHLPIRQARAVVAPDTSSTEGQSIQCELQQIIDVLDGEQDEQAEIIFDEDDSSTDRKLSPIEFESIVDIRKVMSSSNDEDVTIQRGRPHRVGFSFASSHPLYPHYEGCIRTKIMALMLGGPPLPTYQAALKSEAKMDTLAKAIIGTYTPWDLQTRAPMFEPSADGLRSLFKCWGTREASLINRQRFRSISNLLKRGYRNENSGRTYSAWRARNANYWNGLSSDDTLATEQNTAQETTGSAIGCAEALGIITNDEDAFQLLSLTTHYKPDVQVKIRSPRDRFWKTIPESMRETVTKRISGRCGNDLGYCGNELVGNTSSEESTKNATNNPFRLADIAKQIHTLPPPSTVDGSESRNSGYCGDKPT